MPKANVDVDCKNCGHTFQDVLLEKDEDGCYHADIDTRSCNDDYCHTQLCAFCPQFRCSVCDLTLCESHRPPNSDICRVCKEETCQQTK